MHIAPMCSTSEHHPIIVSPKGDSSADALRGYLSNNSEYVADLLLQHGAILFRGFALTALNDFQACATSIGGRHFDYVGGDTPRRRVASDVYTSTEYPAGEVISLHNEMSYLPTWPRRLFFFCETPPKSGGQTSLAYSRDVLRALPTETIEKFKRKHIRYIRNFPLSNRIGKTWQATYATEDRTQVERIIQSQGSSCWWGSDGSLRVETVCQAVTTHPLTGDEVWFNQAEQWHPSALRAGVRSMLEEILGVGRLPHDCTFADGDALGVQELTQIRAALLECKLLFDWRRSDLLMIDNVLMMHGRESFLGDRKILAFLSST